jgi:hypothetical protein
MSSGRFITIVCLFVASASEQRVDDHGDDERRRHNDGEAVTNRPLVSGASREPGGPASVEVRIRFRLVQHQALTSAKAFGRVRAGVAEGSEKRKTPVYAESATRSPPLDSQAPGAAHVVLDQFE